MKTVYLYYIFRIASAMCFIGHGAFGIITKPIWCNYFGVFGIGKELAYQLMPIVGTVDILFGLILLFYPLRIAAAWLVVWGIFTASLRPLSGEPFAEFLERAGNFGAPFILLFLSDPTLKFNHWFKKLEPVVLNDEREHEFVIKCMQVFAFLLLAGHGWLNVIEKQGLIKQYAQVGFHNPSFVAHAIGIFEMTGALLLLIKPIRALVLVLFLWKVCSELFYPAHEIFEWVERGGSYAMLLGLWLALEVKNCSFKTVV